jgi:hypothetical protein
MQGSLKGIEDRRCIEVEVQEYGGEWVPVGTILLPEPGKLGGFRYDDAYSGPALAPDLDYTQPGASRFFAVRPELSPQDRGYNTRDLHSVFNAALPGVWGESVMASHVRSYRNASPAEKLWMLGDWRNGGVRFSSTGPHSMELFIEGSEALEALRADVDRFITRVQLDRAIPFKLGTDRQRWALANTGGTAPKASYMHDDGREYVVKFPREVIGALDEGRIERAMLAVSQEAGLDTAEGLLIEGADGAGVLATRRFGVRTDGSYQHAISGDVALGQPIISEADYLDLVTFLRENGQQPERDIDDLYGRMLLNGFTYNTDDHIGQFVFHREFHGGWALAPNHDLQISDFERDGRRRPHLLSLCGDSEPTYSVDWIDATSREFGITPARGREIAERVIRAVQHLPDYAIAHGVSQETLNEVILPAIRAGDLDRLQQELGAASARMNQPASGLR